MDAYSKIRSVISSCHEIHQYEALYKLIDNFKVMFPEETLYIYLLEKYIESSWNFLVHTFKYNMEQQIKNQNEN